MKNQETAGREVFMSSAGRSFSIEGPAASTKELHCRQCDRVIVHVPIAAKPEPIKSAPKDRYILLCLDGKDWAIGRWNRNLYSNLSHIGGWVNDDGSESTPIIQKPTHWMDLPPLPKETWEYHEPTSESGDLEFWVSSFGRTSFEKPNEP